MLGIVQMLPVAVAAVAPLGWGRRLRGIAIQPLRHIPVVELLAPQHAGEGLALHAAPIRIRQAGLLRGIEGVGFAKSCRDDCVEVGKGL